jgi:hypothetical protein
MMESPLFREHFWQVIIEYENGVRVESDLFRKQGYARAALHDAIGEHVKWQEDGGNTYLRAILPGYHFIPGVRSIHLCAVFVDDAGGHLKRGLKHMIEITCQEEEDALRGTDATE